MASSYVMAPNNGNAESVKNPQPMEVNDYSFDDLEDFQIDSTEIPDLDDLQKMIEHGRRSKNLNPEKYLHSINMLENKYSENLLTLGKLKYILEMPQEFNQPQNNNNKEEVYLD